MLLPCLRIPVAAGDKGRQARHARHPLEVYTSRSLSGKPRFLYRAWRYRLWLEPRQLALLLAKLRRGDWAVDIGAHKGAYTYWMHRRVGTEGKVFAFEPQPALAESIRRNLRRAAQRGTVVVENLALSDQCRQARLFVPEPGDSPGATLQPRHQAGRSYDVQTTTLDAYFSQIPADVRRSIRLIKCDAEGHEREIFAGGADLLRRDRPVLLFESEDRHRRPGNVVEVFAFLESLGYEGTYFDAAGRTRPVQDFDPARDQARPGHGYVHNFFFVHPSSEHADNI